MGETADAIDDSLRRDKSGPYPSRGFPSLTEQLLIYPKIAFDWTGESQCTFMSPDENEGVPSANSPA
jgi:hypothetical protein